MQCLLLRSGARLARSLVRLEDTRESVESLIREGRGNRKRLCRGRAPGPRLAWNPPERFLAARPAAMRPQVRDRS